MHKDKSRDGSGCLIKKKRDKKMRDLIAVIVSLIVFIICIIAYWKLS